jgi:hypothetical protein
MEGRACFHWKATGHPHEEYPHAVHALHPSRWTSLAEHSGQRSLEESPPRPSVAGEWTTVPSIIERLRGLNF